MLALKAGDIQQMELRAEHWDSQTSGDDFYAKNTRVTESEWTEFHYQMEREDADGSRPSPFFSDKRVRWAMTYAMDYDELINTICRGLYQQGLGTFHPTSWMFPKNTPQPVKQDLDRAEDLLEEAGWIDSDGDGMRDKEIDGQVVPFEFQLMTSQSEVGVATATLMKECLERIGVTANVKPTEFVVLQDKLLKHEFDACLGGWSAGTDPDMQSNIYGTGAQRNYGQYSSPTVDELFIEGRRELDPAKRAEIYGKIHMQLWDDQPVTWLFYRNAFFAFNKNLRGYNFGAWGRSNTPPASAACTSPPLRREAGVASPAHQPRITRIARTKKGVRLLSSSFGSDPCLCNPWFLSHDQLHRPPRGHWPGDAVAHHVSGVRVDPRHAGIADYQQHCPDEPQQDDQPRGDGKDATACTVSTSPGTRPTSYGCRTLCGWIWGCPMHGTTSRR